MRISIRTLGLNCGAPSVVGKKLYFVHATVTGEPRHTILLYTAFVPELITLQLTGVIEVV